MKCAHCGAESDGKFCPYCGSEMPRTEQETVNSGEQEQRDQQVNSGEQAQRDQSVRPDVVYTQSGRPVAEEDSLSDKSQLITFVLCGFLGCLGIHHFYAGRIGKGILYLCTWGLFSIGWLLDTISILKGEYTDKQGRRIDGGDRRSMQILSVLLVAYLAIRAVLELCQGGSRFSFLLNVIYALVLGGVAYRKFIAGGQRR